MHLPAAQEVFAALLSMLPPDSAEQVIRAVLSFTSSVILGLFVEEDGVQTYNMFALFRLHADVSGLARFAATIASMPGLQVRSLPRLIAPHLTSVHGFWPRRQPTCTTCA